MTPARNIDNTLTGQIITLVCEVWNVSRTDLVGRSRRRPLPWARAQLCEYLRLYAGHDTVSCAALLHISQQSIADYNYRYQQNRKTYTQFCNSDQQIKESVKKLFNGTKGSKG